MNHSIPAAELAAASRDSISALLSHSAATFGTRPAVRFDHRTWSYVELDEAANRIARHLGSLGLSPGDRVAAFGVNSDVYLLLFLACARGGYVHVPVNFALKGDELVYLLEDSGARVVAVDAELKDLVQDQRDQGRAEQVDVVLELRSSEDGPSLLDIACDESLDSTPVGFEPEAEDVAQLLYTSGTTSAPKGAMMTHRALQAEYVSAVIALDLEAEDRPLIAMPLYHSAAMHVFLMPYLAIGAEARIITRPDMGQILDLVEAERIGSLFLAPTVWVPLSNHPELQTRDLSSLRKAQYGASIMPVTVLQRLRSAYPKIGFYNCFGQSELGPLCTVLRPEEHDARPASCGRPVFNVQARVMGLDGEPAKTGEPGEIQYRSPQLMSGYWNKPDATQDALVDGWFRSGDQVTQDTQGYIQVVDRIKDVINTGGVLVAPREIEDCIYELDEVAEVAVVGRADERWIEAVTAVVVLKEGRDLSPEAVRGHVKSRIADFKVPKRVEFVAELPRNQSGKLLKRILREDPV